MTRHRTVPLALALLLAAGPLADAADDAPALQGFGAATPGGAGQPVYHVTTLADAGPGSLRDALSRGHRHVVFDVAGDIVLERPLVVQGPFVTIDGFTAPAPGITLRKHGVVIRLYERPRRPGGAHDVIVRGLRVRAAAATRSTDCIQVAWGAYNVVIDHVSVDGCGDGAVDITDQARDVTVSWSVLGPPQSGKIMLVAGGAGRISLHHNLFFGGRSRSPSITRQGVPPTADATVDMRNNVVWNWGGGYGTLVRHGAQVNVVANVYGNPTGAERDRRQALIVCPAGPPPPEAFALCGRGDRGAAARGYVKGNASADGVDLDAAGTEAAPFPAPAVDTTDACSAAHRVLARAGARPLDATDRGYLAAVSLAACPTPAAYRSHSRGRPASTLHRPVPAARPAATSVRPPRPLPRRPAAPESDPSRDPGPSPRRRATSSSHSLTTAPPLAQQGGTP